MGDQYEPLGPACGPPPSASRPGVANAAAGTDAKTDVFCFTPDPDLQSIIEPAKKPVSREDSCEKTNLQSIQEPFFIPKKEKPCSVKEAKPAGKSSGREKKANEDSSGRPVPAKERPVKTEAPEPENPLLQKPLCLFIWSAAFFTISVTCFAFLAIINIM